MNSSSKRTLIRFGSIALALVFLVMLFFKQFEARQVYHPRADWIMDPDHLDRPWEKAALQSEDGVALSAWRIAAEDLQQSTNLVVLFCHGNGGNISHRLQHYSLLTESGLDVLAFDYRGYGKSEGKPDEDGTYRDAAAAYDWLIQRGYSPGRVIVMGESLGGAVAAELALNHPIGGLILQSTFTSIPDIGAEIFPFLPVRLLASIRYDTLSKIPKLSVPLVIMHSPADTLVRIEHGRKLFEAANEPKRFVELRGGHNETLDAGVSEWLKGITTLLNLMEQKGNTQ